ncbi:SbcC/MukB-like Walker B domain-containing protein [Nonomuraea sp. NPDC048881]|uniref:ATP-binding protein n=1 Tax=Nonomuraea sp. NPDC048881 TaxID=3155030 RepID=UPI0033E79B65
MGEAMRQEAGFAGQFRLVRLQVVNWGTFCGYKELPIDVRGVLFTGPSGSGKSSLLDGHSVVLLPTREQRFNASADQTAKGTKQGTRSTADYVRGAWSETDDDQGQAQVRYLRAGKPTWSAIAATYDNRQGSVTTAVVVKYFTGTENDAPKSWFQLHDGHFALTELNAWAEREFDIRWFKKAHPAGSYPDGQEAYTRELSKRVGLGSSTTALSLLGKAKAMKNVGDLNLFVRDNMLEEPSTFAAATSMVEKFAPLDEAYETARRAHDQAKVLACVPAEWDSYLAATRTISLAERVSGDPLDRFLRHIHLDVLTAEISRLSAHIPGLQTLHDDQNRRAGDAQKTLSRLSRQLDEQGSALRDLQAALEAAASERDVRAKAFEIYASQVSRLDRPCPHDLATFTALRDSLPGIIDHAQSEQTALAPALHRAHADAGNARTALEGKSKELQVLGSARSLLPPHAQERREDIARATRIPAADLPYAAELIDLADGQERWRPAAEKVLRGFALRLLVPERHKDAVRTYIDTHDMRGVIEYSIVTRVSTHQPKPPATILAGKLVTDPDHPCGPWLTAQLARRFDHACVETARDLEHHIIAVTVNGTIKSGGNHYRKDDRPELTRCSSYILGANTATKRAALQEEVEDLEEAYKQASSHAEQLSQKAQNLRTTNDAATQIGAYIQWSDLDHQEAARRAAGYAEEIRLLKEGDVDLQRLEQQRDDAQKAWEDLVGERSRTADTIRNEQQQHDHLTTVRDLEQARPHLVDDPGMLAYLEQTYARLDVTATPDTITQVGRDLRRDLNSGRATAEHTRKIALTRVGNAISNFIEKWPDAAPDSSGDAERTGGDFCALHTEIEQRRLPHAVSRFQQMISEDMLPSIGLLLFEIDRAAKDIRSRVDMVNVGLRLVEFNTGTHLQIAPENRQFDASREFRRRVDQIMSSAPAGRKDPSVALGQFKRVRELLARFTTNGAEAERWRREVLDVRLSYSFYGREENADRQTINTYRNAGGKSGGEQEKLVAFCLAAALSYNLASPDSGGKPCFAPLMLDEAFGKSDEKFSAQALSAFDAFGFQLLMAAPIRMSGLLEPYIGQAILVDKRETADAARSNATFATFGELAVRRSTEANGAYLASA